MAALLSLALAPVFQALKARGQSAMGSCGSDERGGQCATQGKSARDLPEVEYPVPLVVKNTFIDAGIGRPLSVEGFYLEREVRSTPVSAIGGAAGLWEVPFEPAFGTKDNEGGRSAEPDGSSSRRSTSVGSSSARSGIGEAPSGQSEANTGRSAEPDGSSSRRSTSVRSSSARSGIDEIPSGQSEASPSPAEDTPAGASSARSWAGLPDFEYPASLFVKNTFIDTDLGRPLSIDGFFEERQLRSCPGSALLTPPEDRRELGSGGWGFLGSTPEPSPVLPYCQPRGLPFGLPLPSAESPLGVPAPPTEAPLGVPAPPAEAPRGIPLPPVQPPVLPAELALRQAPIAPLAAPAPAVAPAAPLLLLSNVLPAAAAPGSPALPSVGSGDHHLGTCKPCAHAFSAKGCRNGAQCAFCHLCPLGELKRQQKAKRIAQRKAGAA